MITLGIETSCDETGAAIIDNSKCLSNVVTSSVHLHSKYGGVIPEIASRYHVEYINEVVRESLDKAQKTLEDIELISVTYGPGLCGALLTGISYAKALGYGLSKPVLGVNHLNAHLYSNFLDREGQAKPCFPFIGLIISGGHTSIVLCNEVDNFEILGQTQDDAVGEAFDKVAKILGLGYPGGPIIEKKAKEFSGLDSIDFPRSYLSKDSLDFSFSGIKTSVLYYCKEKKITDDLVYNVAYSFQEAVFDVIVRKVVLACKQKGVNTICVGGGVSANKRFHEKLLKICDFLAIKIFIPEFKFCLDNGAMIAALGEILYDKGHRSDVYFSAVPGLSIG